MVGQLMRWPIGAECGLGSGKGVQSSDEAVLLAFSLLSFLRRHPQPSRSGFSQPSRRVGEPAVCCAFLSSSHEGSGGGPRLRSQQC